MSTKTPNTVVVIGAGIVGVLTAYYLSEQGHKVVLLEKERGGGTGSSYANGAQLSYTYLDPIGNPEMIRHFFSWIQNAAIRIPIRWDPSFWAWGIKLLRQCSEQSFQRNRENLLKLSLYSRALMEAFLEKNKIDFHYRVPGKLHIYSEQGPFDRAVAMNKVLDKAGVGMHVLTPSTCLDFEPALTSRPAPFAGALFSPVDALGDSHLFTNGVLALLAERRGVEIFYNVQAHRFLRERGTIRGVETAKGIIDGDAFVLATGTYGGALLKSINLKLPIYPVKGYVMEFPLEECRVEPKMSVTDHHRKLVCLPLKDRLRVAGIADFTGLDTRVVPERVAYLQESVCKIFPEFRGKEPLRVSTRFRPLTPSSMPFLGKKRYSNLFLNLGHGALGVTLAQACGKVIADLVSGKRPRIDLEGVSL